MTPKRISLTFAQKLGLDVARAQRAPAVARWPRRRNPYPPTQNNVTGFNLANTEQAFTASASRRARATSRYR